MIRFRRGFWGCVLTAAALMLLLNTGAIAQQVFGSIYGTVTDPTGSAVNNAKVTVQDVGKGTSFEVTTNESGNYTKGQLIPGTYKVTIEAPGFQKVVSSEIIVVVDQAARFDTALQVGQATQEVEVTAAAPLLQTDRADVAQTFTAQQINQLPSIGRNLQAFELLNPGTVKQGWAHAADENPQGSVQIQVNGQPFYATGYYLDGTVNQDPILGIIVVNPTFDSVNEVKQAGQDYDSEFDTFSAGLLTYSTKSGSNAFHGDAFDFIFLNTPGFQDFGRNPFVENTQISPGAYAPTTHQNQFGGSIGGPIIKDKLFFFGDAQLTRNIKGGSVLTTVPTAADRTGNLGDWSALGSQYQIYDPATGNPTTGIGRTPFAGNTIPTSRLSPQAQAIMNYFPLPNTQGTIVNGIAAPYNNYASSGALTNNGNQWDTRWDYYQNEKNTFFGRYSYAGFDLSAPGAFGLEAGGPNFNNANYAGSSSTLNQSIAGGWTHTFNPTTINEFRFGFLHYHVTDVPNGVGTSPATQAGIPNLNLDKFYTSGLPYFDIQNVSGNGGLDSKLGYALGVNQCNCPLDENERQYQFVDNLSKIHGNHSFKFGTDVRYALNLRVPSDSHRAGELYFNNNMTGLGGSGGSVTGGLGLGTFLLGDATSFNRYVSSSTNAQEHQKRMFWYAQDEWRPNSKLTITYGTRWEWIFPETVNGPGNGAEYNLNTGLLDVFGQGYTGPQGYQSMNWKNFAPRLGIAYQLDSKTVIRAGYGWSYSLGTFGSTFGHNVTQNPPVLANQSINQQSTCGNNFCDVFNLAQGPSAPPTFSVSPQGTLPCPTGIDCKTRPLTMTLPVVYSYNFTVQRQLTQKMAFTAGYVGNSDRHQQNGVNGDTFDANTIFFLPGFTGDQNTLRPFDGLYGPRYNYGNTSSIDNYCNCSNSRYDSFQGTLTIQNMAGFNLQGNYTYQLSQGDGLGVPDANYTFLYDRPLGYVNNSNFPMQQWVLAGNYDIPFGRGRKFGASSNRFVDAVLGGWNLSTIFTYYSGRPFYPTIDSYPGKPYTGPNNVPNIGTGSPYAPNGGRNAWILPLSSGAYSLPAANTFGNYPINQLYGPQFTNVDASVMKQFSITERFKFTLRFDATNALNHTNLDLPNGDVQSPSVGQITNIAFNGNGYTMRRVQYSGILNW